MAWPIKVIFQNPAANSSLLVQRTKSALNKTMPTRLINRQRKLATPQAKQLDKTYRPETR